MRLRPYGEPEPEESPLGDFLIGVFLGSIGFPMAYGWVFVSLGWVQQATLMVISLIGGVLLGARMAWGSWCRKQTKRKEQHEARRFHHG